MVSARNLLDEELGRAGLPFDHKRHERIIVLHDDLQQRVAELACL